MSEKEVEQTQVEAARRCLNPKCKRTCNDDRKAKVRILGGRTVRYCCHHCMIVHASTGVVTKPAPKIPLK